MIRMQRSRGAEVQRQAGYKNFTAYCLLSTVYCLLSTSLVFGEVKIGYIDSNRILNEYAERDVLKEELESKLKKWEQKVMTKKQAILDAVKLFESQGAMLTASARERKQKEIERMQAEYETFVQQIWGQDGEAKRLNEEVMKPFIDKVNLILQKLGEEQGFTIIFDVASTGIVYTKEGMELTDMVIAELNQEFAPVVQREGKTYFWVFKFKELTGEAIEYEAGNKIASSISKAFGMFEGFEAVKADKISRAMEQVSINKKEEEFTIQEAAQVGKWAEAKFVITGEVTRVGEKIDITCKVIDTQTNMVMAQEVGSSQKAEREDINTMVSEVVSKLREKLKEGK